MNKFEVAFENEAMFLGCILKDPTLLDESTVLPHQFLSSGHQEIYKSMQDLLKEGKEISMLSLMQLGESKVAKFGGRNYLADLIAGVPSIHGFNGFQQNVLSFHVVQEAQDAVKEFLERTKETHKVKDLSLLIKEVSELEGSTVKNHQSFKQKLADRVSEHLESLKTGLSGINAGFLNLNKFTDGWQKTDLIIVAARPSMGKTAFVLNSFMNGLRKDPDTFGTFFSIEMAEGPVIDRMIAMQGGINLMKMRNPNKTFVDDEWERHSKAIGIIENMNFDIRRENTIPEIRAAIRRNIRNHPDKKHVVGLDFLTLIRHMNPSGNKHHDISDIVIDLKNIAVEFKVPFIVISQLSRGVEARQDKRPNMSDLTESGTIEQIADVIALLYRDDYYNKDTDLKNIVEVNFAKNRQGQTGTLNFKFQKATNVFTEVL
ncbi:replicative DNA helicase [Metabacillus sp. 84]|uniref:replicative DNA helicase n=1 Tax=Metabacillus sp. 84 TaxID=3404705 RepID=UPI003CEDA164